MNHVAAVRNYSSTPSEAVGWQAIEETVSRVASPHVSVLDATSPMTHALSPSTSDKTARRSHGESDVIHVDEPTHRRSGISSEDETSATEVNAPILAEDEVAKDPTTGAHFPAVEPGPGRRGSAFEIDEPSSRPSSRPGSRPTSVYKEPAFDHRPTPLEDVEEYEPLFPEGEKQDAKPSSPEALRKEVKQRFPSQDIWEDVPSSVHYTAEVSTPDLPQERTKPVPTMLPPRDTETPAQAFARHQEELAEKEAREYGSDGLIPRHQQKPSWAKHQTHLVQEAQTRPSMAQRFPSRDVWEDTPDSLKLEAAVSTPEPEREASPSDAKEHRRGSTESASVPSDTAKPAIPGRPKPRQSSSDDNISKPLVPERPKPQVPARPAKAGPTSGGLEPGEAAAQPKPKPAVPLRPVGSKIAALQAGFMSDLNNRLRLGPPAPKKADEAASEDGPAEEKDKLPLPDVRKGRARGPQRRAPAAKSPIPADPAPAASFVFSSVSTLWEIDPEQDDGRLVVAKQGDAAPASTEPAESENATRIRSAGDPWEEEASEEAKVDQEPKTLATNMAGEPVVEEHVKDEKGADEETVITSDVVQTCALEFTGCQSTDVKGGEGPPGTC